jgi:hypothetical protein
MRLRRIKCRVTLLNLMLAIAMLSITLAITRPSTEIWPTYLAVTWISARASAHDPVTHAAFAQEFTSPTVIRDALADPTVSGIASIQAAADPRRELLNELLIEIHPRGQGYIAPARELIRVVVESASASEAVLVRDALVGAYLRYHNLTTIVRVSPALPERVPHPFFDRPWKFRATTTLGISLCIATLIVPIKRSARFWRSVVTTSIVGLILGASLWWLVSHPEFHLHIGTFRLL